MQIIFDSKEKTILKLEKGEEFMDAMVSIAKERDMSFGFSMIGGSNFVTLSYFDTEEGKYLTKDFSYTRPNIEILSCNGTVAWYKGEPIVHAHGVFSTFDYNCFGGHVIKINISITGEVIINWLPEKLKREDAGGELRLLCK